MPSAVSSLAPPADVHPGGEDPIQRLLAPRSIAVVGASNRSRWSRTLVENLDNCGYQGRVSLINPRGGIVHDRQAFRSCGEVDGGIDMGVVLVPGSAVLDVVTDLADAGARSAMILTSGFAETGGEGVVLQEKLVQFARARRLRLFGPNSLGYLNFADRVLAWATPIKAPSRSDGVGIVSQSGATALFMANLAYEQDIGLSHVIATGNEADTDGTAFLDHLIERPETRAIALFIETVRNPPAFIRSAQKALARGKPIVVLKVGTSEVTARSAEAHTGALVGDDRVFEGICRQYGIIRVGSVEELLATADIAARTGVLRPGGLAVLSNSGGICEIAADRAEERGVSLPELTAETAAQVRELIPGYGTPHNPLDLTGGIDPANCEQIVRLLSRQGDYAAILCPYYPVPTEQDQISERLSALHSGLARGLSDEGVPGLLVSYTSTYQTELSRGIVERDRLPYHACGLDRAVAGIAGVMRWSERQRSASPATHTEPMQASLAARPRSEHEALLVLKSFGVPVVPTRLATTSTEAAAMAAEIDKPVAVKIASPNIAHKSDIGGVVLGVLGLDNVRRAFDEVVGAARRHHAAARIDGAIISPMRRNGLELFVGCTRDPQWGPVIALGLGGVWVEVMKDVSLRLLPVDAVEVKRMLGELRGAALLRGQRGVPATDLDAVADAVMRIGAAAAACGPDLRALEVNPLWVRGDKVEALDALFDWEPEASSPDPA
ncbi:acyl-CoA synthetase (NDP forming) [Mesorhizobium sp. J18]|uniref:acetate--CoA ligase family protein n=1 Tax=Mesorhizobium sp. J18 TaxID=935263 RepID=UPI00119C4CEE|nr:acetate--CoA ligase family protein [Mesorhizobium sp. J18]TWG92815.1 acyl-CoA synthetase (NDP forming) [Mesorhizobium sp. J18]